MTHDPAPTCGGKVKCKIATGLCPSGRREAKLWVRKVGSEFDFPSETADRDVALLQLLADVSAQGA